MGERWTLLIVRDAIFRSFGAYDDLGEIVGEAVKGVDTEGLKHR